MPENGQILVQEAHPGREVGHAQNPSYEGLPLPLSIGLGSRRKQSEQLLGRLDAVVHGCPQGQVHGRFIPGIIVVKLDLAALGIDQGSDVDSVIHSIAHIPKKCS